MAAGLRDSPALQAAWSLGKVYSQGGWAKCRAGVKGKKLYWLWRLLSLRPYL
jgi:hypothetical protein